MKIVENKKEKIKKKQINKPKKDHVLVVAQEIKFARLLSGNEKKSRDRALKTLKKWLINCFQKEYEFKEDDFVRVWKGLFYAVWMSDKPLIQEDLCESIAGILDQFPKEQYRHCLLMVKAGFKVLATEWYGIDQHRMDKYLMLVRRYLRGSLRCLLRTGWSLEACQSYTEMLTNNDGLLSLETPHYARNAMSMTLHVTDCFLEELSKVSEGDISEDSLVELLRPFCLYTTGGEVLAVCIACRRLLTALVRQSELGLRYNDATLAWKSMGCPKGGPEALELVSDDEQENGDDMEVSLDADDQTNEKVLDPRAGYVDVTLNPLPVPASKLADMLRQMLANASSKAHRRVKICMQRFEKLARNEYPLPIQASDIERDCGPRLYAQRSLKSLRALEKKLANTSDELALRGLSRKHRKRLLAKSRSGASIVEDAETVRQTITNTTNGDWQVETTEPDAKKPKRDLNETKKRKENADKLQDKRTKKAKVSSTDEVSKNIENGKKEKVDLKINSERKIKKHKEGMKKDIVDKRKEDKVNKVDNFNKKNNEKVNSTSKNDKSKKNKAELKISESRNNKVEGKASKGNENDNLNVKEKTKLSNGAGTKEEAEVKKKLTEKRVKEVKPTFLVNKVKNYQKLTNNLMERKTSSSPKKVKFVLKNNSMQKPVDYYKSVRQSPSIPFDSGKRPVKTNLKPSTPSPINPFFKKKMKIN